MASLLPHISAVEVNRGENLLNSQELTSVAHDELRGKKNRSLSEEHEREGGAESLLQWLSQAASGYWENDLPTDRGFETQPNAATLFNGKKKQKKNTAILNHSLWALFYFVCAHFTWIRKITSGNKTSFICKHIHSRPLLTSLHNSCGFSGSALRSALGRFACIGSLQIVFWSNPLIVSINRVYAAQTCCCINKNLSPKQFFECVLSVRAVFSQRALISMITWMRPDWT